MTADNSPDLSLVVDYEICAVDAPEFRPLIPEGEYHFKLITHETVIKFGTPRLILLMTVIDLGEEHGTALSCYRNVKTLKGRPRKRGGFVPSRGGDFMAEYCSLVPDYNPRIDRISLNRYYNNIIKAKVSTVKTNNRNKKLPEQLWWSKVDELLDLVEELPT